MTLQVIFRYYDEIHFYKNVRREIFTIANVKFNYLVQVRPIYN